MKPIPCTCCDGHGTAFSLDAGADATCEKCEGSGNEPCDECGESAAVGYSSTGNLLCQICLDERLRDEVAEPDWEYA